MLTTTVRCPPRFATTMRLFVLLVCTVAVAEPGAQFASKSILDRFRVGADVDAVWRAIRDSVRMMGRAGFVHSNGAGFLFHARR